MVVLALNFYFHAPIVDPSADDLWPINRHARISNEKKNCSLRLMRSITAGVMVMMMRFCDGQRWNARFSFFSRTNQRQNQRKKCCKCKESTCRVNTCALQITERETMGAKMTIVNTHLFNIRQATATATCSAVQRSLQLPHLRFQLVCESQLDSVFRTGNFRDVFGHNSYSHSCVK